MPGLKTLFLCVKQPFSSDYINNPNSKYSFCHQATIFDYINNPNSNNSFCASSNHFIRLHQYPKLKQLFLRAKQTFLSDKIINPKKKTLIEHQTTISIQNFIRKKPNIFSTLHNPSKNSTSELNLEEKHKKSKRIVPEHIKTQILLQFHIRTFKKNKNKKTKNGERRQTT